MTIQIIQSDVNNNLTIINGLEGEGIAMIIARVVGRDMDDMINEMYEQRFMTTKEHINDPAVEFFQFNQKTYQKTPDGMRCWICPPNVTINLTDISTY